MEDIKKETIEGIFDAILKGCDKDNKERNEELYDYLRKNIKWLREPDTYETMIAHPLNCMVNAVLKEVYNDSENIYIISDLYLRHRFISINLRELICKAEGMTCCQDKVNSILRLYLKFAIENIKEELPEKREGLFLPKVGTIDQWFRLIEGLMELIYGKPKKYLKSYLELANAYSKIGLHG